MTNQYLTILNPLLIIFNYLKGHKRVGSKVHLGLAMSLFADKMYTVFGGMVYNQSLPFKKQVNT